MEYVGIDWATRRAACCRWTRRAVDSVRGAVPADEYGLMRLVAGHGPEVTATVEMMSGAAWIAETLRGAGWQVKVADARRARAPAPLAAKTDKIDARVLAELARRDLVPEVPTHASSPSSPDGTSCRRSGCPRSMTAPTLSCHCVGCT